MVHHYSCFGLQCVWLPHSRTSHIQWKFFSKQNFYNAGPTFESLSSAQSLSKLYGKSKIVQLGRKSLFLLLGLNAQARSLQKYWKTNSGLLIASSAKCFLVIFFLVKDMHLLETHVPATWHGNYTLHALIYASRIMEGAHANRRYGDGSLTLAT